jgi:hypothetical protein
LTARVTRIERALIENSDAVRFLGDVFAVTKTVAVHKTCHFDSKQIGLGKHGTLAAAFLEEGGSDRQGMGIETEIDTAVG